MTKISPGTVIVGIFAVLFGLVGAYAVRQQLAAKPAPEPAAPEAPRPVLVPVAAVDLEPGRSLTVSDVVILRLLPGQLESQGIRGAYMRDSEQIVGRILKQPLTKGATFFPDQFYPQGLGPSIAERLKPGFRAVTVPIENAAAVAGMATPGSVVDVLFRSTPDKEKQTPETTVMLLENVEVLALGDVSTPGAQAAGDARPSRNLTVTLAVSPKQAGALQVVQGRGEMSLAMRNPEDRVTSAAAPPQTLEGLLGLPQPVSLTTEIYRGTTRNTVTFVDPAPRSFQLDQLPVRADAAQPTSLEHHEQAPPAETTPIITTGWRGRHLARAQLRRGLSGLPLE